MKKNFPGFYRPTKEEFAELWATCIFVVDANVLLNLYRYTSKTADQLIGILKDISDRLWIPYQAAFDTRRIVLR